MSGTMPTMRVSNEAQTMPKMPGVWILTIATITVTVTASRTAKPSCKVTKPATTTIRTKSQRHQPGRGLSVLGGLGKQARLRLLFRPPPQKLRSVPEPAPGEMIVLTVLPASMDRTGVWFWLPGGLLRLGNIPRLADVCDTFPSLRPAQGLAYHADVLTLRSLLLK